MYNPEKLATYHTQDEDKQNKNTTKYVLDTNIRKQTQIMQKKIKIKIKDILCYALIDMSSYIYAGKCMERRIKQWRSTIDTNKTIYHLSPKAC